MRKPSVSLKRDMDLSLFPVEESRQGRRAEMLLKARWGQRYRRGPVRQSLARWTTRFCRKCSHGAAARGHPLLSHIAPQMSQACPVAGPVYVKAKAQRTACQMGKLRPEGLCEI